MTERENYLKTVRLQNPKWIPMHISTNLASLIEYKGEMEEVITRYPEFFGPFTKGSIDYSRYGDGSCDIVEHDSWGYDWHYSMHGIEGCVTAHPLADWANLAHYKAPDPDLTLDRGGKRDWEREFASIKQRKEKGQITQGGLVHGFLFLRLQYLRGFENLMCDMYDEEPNLDRLISMIDEHNLKIIERYCQAGVDIIEVPEDLGAESSMIISREMFRRYIKPSYRKITDICKQNKALIAIHSDGYILDIIDDLIDVGMDIINPQDLCNGIDNLKRELKGKACIRLDIDRVKITPYGTRNEIFELIEEEVKVLGSPHGGLEFIYGVYPPVTPDRLNYLCEALKKYQRYWWE